MNIFSKPHIRDTSSWPWIIEIAVAEMQFRELIEPRIEKAITVCEVGSGTKIKQCEKLTTYYSCTLLPFTMFIVMAAHCNMPIGYFISSKSQSITWIVLLALLPTIIHYASHCPVEILLYSTQHTANLSVLHFSPQTGSHISTWLV